MNVTPFLLILFLVSTCVGEEQNNSPRSSILARTNTCPDPADIEPCECTNQDSLIMDCSKVQDEEQLRKVFSVFFPTAEFYEFKMTYNKNVKVLEDAVFGNVSFLVLDIKHSVLETVKSDALTSSLSTLEVITIEDCQLSTFPFERLAEFTSLILLSFHSNKLHTLPPLSSSSLRQLSLGQNQIVHVSPYIFKPLPVVQMIFLNENNLMEIPIGTFTGLPKLEYLSLYSNNISDLHSLTFELVTSPSYTASLFLDNNNIDSVEVDTFKGVEEPADITMNNNALTRLPEEVWRPVLEKDINVKLAGNPLTCGCDVAWLVRDPQLLTKVTDARCADGTMLTDLNPADFDICG